jgi:hypothetical protein
MRHRSSGCHLRQVHMPGNTEAQAGIDPEVIFPKYGQMARDDTGQGFPVSGRRPYQGERPY